MILVCLQLCGCDVLLSKLWRMFFCFAFFSCTHAHSTSKNKSAYFRHSSMHNASKSGFSKIRYKKLHLLSENIGKALYVFFSSSYSSFSFSWITKIQNFLRKYKYSQNIRQIFMIFRKEYGRAEVRGMYASLSSPFFSINSNTNSTLCFNPAVTSLLALHSRTGIFLSQRSAGAAIVWKVPGKFLYFKKFDTNFTLLWVYVNWIHCQWKTLGLHSVFSSILKPLHPKVNITGNECTVYTYWK